MSKQITCPECFGDGTVGCDACDETGENMYGEPCEECNGAIYVTCPTCGGSSYIEVPEDNEE